MQKIRPVHDVAQILGIFRQLVGIQFIQQVTGQRTVGQRANPADPLGQIDGVGDVPVAHNPLIPTKYGAAGVGFHNSVPFNNYLYGQQAAQGVKNGVDPSGKSSLVHPMQGVLALAGQLT